MINFFLFHVIYLLQHAQDFSFSIFRLKDPYMSFTNQNIIVTQIIIRRCVCNFGWQHIIGL